MPLHEASIFFKHLHRIWKEAPPLATRQALGPLKDVLPDVSVRRRSEGFEGRPLAFYTIGFSVAEDLVRHAVVERRREWKQVLDLNLVREEVLWAYRLACKRTNPLVFIEGKLLP